MMSTYCCGVFRYKNVHAFGTDAGQALLNEIALTCMSLMLKGVGNGAAAILWLKRFQNYSWNKKTIFTIQTTDTRSLNATNLMTTTRISKLSQVNTKTGQATIKKPNGAGNMFLWLLCQLCCAVQCYNWCSPDTSTDFAAATYPSNS